MLILGCATLAPAPAAVEASSGSVTTAQQPTNTDKTTTLGAAATAAMGIKLGTVGVGRQ